MTSTAVVVASVATLHELIFENPVEGAVLVVFLLGLVKFLVSSFLAGAVSPEVFNCMWLVVPEMNLERA